MSSNQDQTLINQLILRFQQNNDQDAFSQLYDIHKQLIKAISYKNQLPHIDYESEMNFAFYNAARTFKVNNNKNASFNTYFKTCVDNQIKVCLTYLNAYKRQCDKNCLSLDMPCNDDDSKVITLGDNIPDDKVDLQDILNTMVIQQAKKLLNEQEQKLLDYIYAGYNYKEIGQFLGITAAAIKARLKKIQTNKEFLHLIKLARSKQMREVFLIIDGNSIACRAAFAQSNLNNDTGTIYKFLKSFISMVKKINPTHLVICWDVSRITWRSKLYPQYKCNRGEAFENNKINFNEIKQILNLIGVKNVELNNYEGDDLVGTFANLSTADETYIMSGDRDVFQCVTDTVSVMYPTKDGYIKVDKDYLLDNYGIDGEEYVQVKALMGDSGDNIPGIKGVSIKTAVKILNEYKDIHNIIEQEEIHINKTVDESFHQWKKQANTILKLVTINERVPVKIDMDDCICKLDWYQALPVFRKLQFESFITKINQLPKGRVL